MDSNYKSMNYLLSGECNQFRPLRPLFRECSNPCLQSIEHSETPLDEFSFKLETEKNEFDEDLLKSEHESQMLDSLNDIKVFTLYFL